MLQLIATTKGTHPRENWKCRSVFWMSPSTYNTQRHTNTMHTFLHTNTPPTHTPQIKCIVDSTSFSLSRTGDEGRSCIQWEVCLFFTKMFWYIETSLYPGQLLSSVIERKTNGNEGENALWTWERVWQVGFMLTSIWIRLLLWEAAMDLRKPWNRLTSMSVCILGKSFQQETENIAWSIKGDPLFQHHHAHS